MGLGGRRSLVGNWLSLGLGYISGHSLSQDVASRTRRRRAKTTKANESNWRIHCGTAVWNVPRDSRMGCDCCFLGQLCIESDESRFLARRNVDLVVLHHAPAAD